MQRHDNRPDWYWNDEYGPNTVDDGVRIKRLSHQHWCVCVRADRGDGSGRVCVSPRARRRRRTQYRKAGGAAAATAFALGGKKRPHITREENEAAHARTATAGSTSNRNRPYGFPSQSSDDRARKFPLSCETTHG